MRMKFKTYTEAQKNRVNAVRNDLANAGYHIDFCTLADGVVWDMRNDTNITFKDGGAPACGVNIVQKMNFDDEIAMEEVIDERLMNYERMMRLGIKVSWVGGNYIVDGTPKEPLKNTEEQLKIEDVISARLDNYETMKELGINAVWIGADYTTIDDVKKEDKVEDITFKTVVIVGDKSWKG